MADRLERLRKKLRFRSLRRGTREGDLVLGGFADRIGRLDHGQLARLEALLDEDDQDVLAWIAGVRPAPPAFRGDMLDMLMDFGKKRTQHFD